MCVCWCACVCVMRCNRLKLKANPDTKHFQPSHLKQKRCNPFKAAMLWCVFTYSHFYSCRSLSVNVWFASCFGRSELFITLHVDNTKFVVRSRLCAGEKTQLNNWKMPSLPVLSNYSRKEASGMSDQTAEILFSCQSYDRHSAFYLAAHQDRIQLHWHDQEGLSCETDVTACAWNPLWKKLVIESVEVEATILKHDFFKNNVFIWCQYLDWGCFSHFQYNVCYFQK